MKASTFVGVGFLKDIVADTVALNKALHNVKIIYRTSMSGDPIIERKKESWTLTFL